MRADLNGKLAVVTGGAKGIGFSCAKVLLDSGARVALVDNLADTLTKAQDALSSYGLVKSYTLDISKPEAIAAVIERICAELGDIEILVQAAGYVRGKPALDITCSDWDAVMNVNTRGLFFMMQQVVARSMSRTGGSIVNVASLAGIRGLTAPMFCAHYSASEGGVVALTKQAAVEWAHLGVRVNAVAPGGMQTGPMAEMEPPPEVLNPIPLKKLSGPEDIANAACFLSSDLAKMITGQILVIDGGASIVGY